MLKPRTDCFDGLFKFCIRARACLLPVRPGTCMQVPWQWQPTPRLWVAGSRNQSMESETNPGICGTSRGRLDRGGPRASPSAGGELSCCTSESVTGPVITIQNHAIDIHHEPAAFDRSKPSFISARRHGTTTTTRIWDNISETPRPPGQPRARRTGWPGRGS